MKDRLQRQYNETPYRDQTFAQLDLSRILGLARLFELGPTRSETPELRVLDLACASGEHVRSQAARYPNVQFTGVDFSSNEIEAGSKAIVESGATNVELVLADLREYEVLPGEYDLVLCHGAFSWVPDEVKDRVFALARTALKKKGVAAVAYLTYPGWKQRESIRELVAHRVRDINDPQERIKESALLLRLLRAGYEAQVDNPDAQALLGVVRDMQESSANMFLHDELGSIHDPCYFTQFVEWAAEWGLQYLAEAELGTMALDGLPDAAQGFLQQIAPDFLETQQLIDFVVNRSGRTSLLVRNDAPVGRELNLDALNDLGFRTNLRAGSANASPATEATEFMTLQGQTLTLDSGAAAAIVEHMLEWTDVAPTLAELAQRAANDGHRASDVADSLLPLIARGYVDPYLAVT